MQISDYLISRQATVLDALKKLNNTRSFTLFVTDDQQRVVGALTDGDIRRGLIAGASLQTPVSEVCLKRFRYLDAANYCPATLHDIRQKGIRLVPYLTEDGRVERLIDLQQTKALLPVDAVIMAGGRGERLRPLTDTCPKPLLPLGDKPILEYNIDRLAAYGIENLYLCVRYLGQQIKDYFGDGRQRGLRIRYVDEDQPLGTLGAVSRISRFDHDTVLIMNSDLFTNINLEDFYNHFVDNQSDMAVASVPYNVTVPYAVMETEGQRIRSFVEKPTYSYYSNGGIYLVRRAVLEQLKPDRRFDATDLMQQLIDQGGRLTYFPLVGYWIDIGKPDDYRKARELIQYVKSETL